MVYCSMCGAENEKGVRFCYKCGYMLQTNPPKKEEVEKAEAKGPEKEPAKDEKKPALRRERKPAAAGDTPPAPKEEPEPEPAPAPAPRPAEEAKPHPPLPRGYVYSDKGDIYRRIEWKVDTDPAVCDRFRIPALVLAVLSLIPLLYLLFFAGIDLEYAGVTVSSTTFYGVAADGWGTSLFANGMITIMFWIALICTILGLVNQLSPIIASVIVLFETLFVLTGTLTNGLLVATVPSSFLGQCAMVLVIEVIICLLGMYCAERYGDKYIPENRGAAKRLFAYLLDLKKH